MQPTHQTPLVVYTFLQAVLAGMEAVGVRLDLNQLDVLRTKVEAELARVEASSRALLPEGFAGASEGAKMQFLTSPKQLGALLFAGLGLPTKGVKKTGTGAFSTDQQVGQYLKCDRPCTAPVPPKQLGALLLGRLGLPTQGMKSTGAFLTDQQIRSYFKGGTATKIK